MTPVILPIINAKECQELPVAGLKMPFSREHKCEWRSRWEVSRIRHECEWRDRWEAAEFGQETAPRIDPQSGMGNPPHFERDFEQAIARAKRHGSPFCIVLLEAWADPARQRPVSDALHLALSHLLLRIARLEDSLSELTWVRWGIILAETPESGGRAFIDRVHAALAARADASGRQIATAAGLVEGTGEDELLALLLRAELALESSSVAFGKPRDESIVRAG
jgi:PleD family two-component response regulator